MQESANLVKQSHFPKSTARAQRKKSLSQDQEEELERIFSDIILFHCSGDPGRDISMKDIKKRMNGNELFLKELEQKLNDEGNTLSKRIYDKVRNLIKSRKPGNTE